SNLFFSHVPGNQGNTAATNRSRSIQVHEVAKITAIQLRNGMTTHQSFRLMPRSRIFLTKQSVIVQRCSYDFGLAFICTHERQTHRSCRETEHVECRL